MLRLTLSLSSSDSSRRNWKGHAPDSTHFALDAKLQDIERFVMKRLGDIHGLLTGDVPRAKSELAKHCTEITLTPEGRTYRISGDWNLLGGRSDGAGGGNWIERLPVHFNWQAAA
jgi:hypothetical protein